MYNLLYVNRHRRRMTQAQLAACSGVSRGTICDLERTGRIPSIAVGVRLCRALDCSFEEVFPIDLSM
ncbi:MAG: helix-turn-helix transcriptional regulator [Clostridia bacterium]|nr:helix-turn-helix transcriptional regulator [Clostridia bacterium]